MLNIYELEKRWLQYKIKSYIPYIVLVLSILFITTALVFFFEKTPQENKIKKETLKTNTIQTVQKVDSPHKEQTKKKGIEEEKYVQKETNTTKKQIKIEKKVVKKEPIPQVKAPTIIKNRHNEKKIILQPSMEFLKNFHHTSNNAQKISTEKKHTTKRTQIAKIELPEEEYVTDKTKKAIQPQKPLVKSNPKPIAITIKRRESENDIKEVIARFQKNNNPALSLFAAKKYYELGNYKQAYNYALITNKINNDIEESWLIFAKALVKLGQKDQAVKTLRQYIKYSHSSNAQILLDEIQRGKFR